MTAVEWLEKELKKIPFVNPKEVFEQAKEMEKQQIIDAYRIGECEVGLMIVNKPEQYYNETYGSKGSDATSSQTEISDEEITKLANEHILYNDSKRQWVIEGMKLYREHLKQK